jgi:hypothetical protein
MVQSGLRLLESIPLSASNAPGGAHTLGQLLSDIAQSHNIELPLNAFQNWVPSWVGSTLTADFGQQYNKVIVPALRTAIGVFGDAVAAAGPALFFDYLLHHSLQNNPQSLLVGPDKLTTNIALREMASNPAFTQAANSLAQNTPIGQTSSGAVQIEFTSPKNLFWAVDNAGLHYTITRTSATQYTMQAWINGHFNFSLHIQGALQSPQFFVGWTAADVLMLFEVGQVIQAYPWNTTTLTVSGDLATGAVTLQNIGTTNPA